MAAEEPATLSAVASGRAGGATRGFLFSDLRGYTAFVDQRGAQAAADLLDRYRTLVRAAVARHDGAEVRTEGDSFYVVFPSVSGALRCGLEIVDDAARGSGPAAAQIDVGVGVHAGETIETAEGYVGQAVNIAARLCALAAPGEVLVSDTVRSLTQGISDVRFTPRGRRRLKGVSEPVAVFAAHSPATAGAGSPSRPRYARPAVMVALAVGVVALLGLAVLAMRPAIVPRESWTIGLSMPVSGEMETFVEPLVRAVELALAEAAEAGGVAGSQVVLDIRDHAGGEFGEDPGQAEANAAAFVADEAVVAMIGPLQSDLAAALIPITNAAGLLQCGSSTTDPRLTKPEAGALLLRAAQPNQINFIRLPAPADVEARAVASFAFHDLEAARALVIDDTLSVGGGLADSFEREFEALGGSVVRRALNPGADPLELLAPLDAAADAPELVFFGGFTSTGAAQVRRAMVEAGHGSVPFVGWDGLFDGSGEEPQSFIGAAGDAAAGSYVSHPSVGTVANEFERSYREAYGALPEGGIAEYAASSHACAEIILHALTAVLPGTAEPVAVREAVRAYVVDPRNQFETVIGPVSFDENGDSVRQLVTFYRVDPNAANGAGDWQFMEQQDFGPGR